MRILSTPPHAAGDGTSGWKGWWFFFRVSSGTLGAEASMVGVVLFFSGASSRLGGFRLVGFGVPGVGGGSALKMVGFSDFPFRFVPGVGGGSALKMVG